MGHMWNFVGDAEHVTLRNDNSKELIAAGLLLRERVRVTFKNTIEHRPQSHGIAERWGQEVISSTRCLIKQSGLTEDFWSYAVPYWTLAYNLQTQSGLDGKSPLGARHEGFEQKHKLIPFGHNVLYRPLPTEVESKWQTRGVEGIMLGCHVQSDGTPDGSCFVASIANVVAFLLDKEKLHVVRTIDVKQVGVLDFPLVELRAQAKAVPAIGLQNVAELVLQLAE